VFNPLDHPAVAFTLAYIRTRVEPLRARSDRGASALETAIIAAVLIAAAVLIGGIVIQKVRDGADVVENTDIPKAP
jgi:alkylation response protein AidB-like acyl-CoA dehydrogenase